MHSTTIFLLAFGLLATVAMARPGRRPWSGHQHGHGGNKEPGENGQKWSVFNLPGRIRLPLRLAQKLEQPRPTFTAKKIFDGKYLIISPALIFKFKAGNNNDTDISTTAMPETTTVRPTRSTTEEPETEEPTTTPIDEESTTTAVDEDSTTTASGEEEEETTTPTPLILLED